MWVAPPQAPVGPLDQLPVASIAIFSKMVLMFWVLPPQPLPLQYFQVSGFSDAFAYDILGAAPIDAIGRASPSAAALHRPTQPTDGKLVKQPHFIVL